jgi:hypothetical protein
MKGDDMSYQEQAMRGAAQPAREISGWAVGFTIFAGMVMIMAGAFQAIQGLAAVFEDDFFVLTRNYAFDLDVSTWGWIHLVWGIIVAAAGFSLFSGAVWARVVAVGIALVTGIVNFFYIPYYPVWSILIIALSIGVIWALTAHGRDIAADQP